MCNRYTPSSLEFPTFKTWLATHPTNFPPQSWRAIGPSQEGLYLRPDDGEIRLYAGRWGMIRPGLPEQQEYKARTVMRKGQPVEVREPLLTNNCRSETMARKATFRQAWAKGKRCIIPATGFQEPCWETGRSQWWEFRRIDGEPWGIAGLWSEWTDPETGELVPNYTMPTVNADQHPLMSRMHRPELDAEGRPKPEQDKRSVVPLDPSKWHTWLFGTNEEALATLVLPRESEFDAGPAEPELQGALF